MDVREQYWLEYYEGVAREGSAWLDYSNERVQSQSFGLALEAAGPIRGKACLDVGCGRGGFSNVLASLGAASVTGLDLVPELIDSNARSYPRMQWVQGTLADADARGALDTYDLVIFLEVLQYVPLDRTLEVAWRRLRAGGRVIAIFPNVRCPIVMRTRHRFDANYAPPAIEDAAALLARAPDCECVHYRGLAFGADQRVAPYETTPWQTAGRWMREPNRIQIVAQKRAHAAGTDRAE